MRILLVHPSPLTYSEIYLRLEPLGLERVATVLMQAGHQVRLLDLQVFTHADLQHELREFEPQAVGFSLNYLANVPEVVDLAKSIKRAQPKRFVFVGGHSASFVAHDLIEHGEGAIDCVLRGEGEASIAELIEAVGDRELIRVPGVITAEGDGPPPRMVDGLERFMPARGLARRRRLYFIGVLDPCASVEFTRGCPWDCSFCSAWTFYGRSYRKLPAEAAAEDLASIAEPNVFIVDDVAFVHPEDGFAIGREIERHKVKKNYYLETRTDVLCRNEE
ncbi:MAG TPA: cobalamin-dependent protein, partial [Terriglobales bacterium]|nr:cobalamin-dependent protein [Terriglobales bacterium]